MYFLKIFSGDYCFSEFWQAIMTAISEISKYKCHIFFCNYVIFDKITFSWFTHLCSEILWSWFTYFSTIFFCWKIDSTNFKNVCMAARNIVLQLYFWLCHTKGPNNSADAGGQVLMSVPILPPTHQFWSQEYKVHFSESNICFWKQCKGFTQRIFLQKWYRL